MAQINPFKQYGVKEVCDVMFFDTVTKEIKLRIDTLQVSSLAQTSDVTEQRGGQSNPVLVSWDYNKSVDIELTDALMSPASLNMLLGNKDAVVPSSTAKPTELYDFETVVTGTGGAITLANINNADALDVSALNAEGVVDAADITNDGAGNITIGTASGEEYEVFYRHLETAGKSFNLVINSATFPGTYKVVMKTVIREKETGIDQDFQIVIPIAKMSGEVNLNMESAGDASTFNMPLKVMKPKNGDMVIMSIIEA